MSKKMLLMGVVLLAIASTAWGWSYCGYKWKTSSPMGESYYVYANTSDCTGELAAVQAADYQWDYTGDGCFTFTYGGTTTRNAPSYDYYNVVRWKNLSPGIVGQTSIWVYSADRTSIAECDLVFNDYYLWNSSATCPSNRMDVQDVATHELGHFLCLADLYAGGDAEKTMYGYVAYGETKKRTLHSDDIAGIQGIYGRCPR